MKHTRKLLMAAMALVLTLLLFAAMPTAVFAKDVTSTITGTAVMVTADGIHIDPVEADGEKEITHTLTVRASKGAFSSFELYLRMPAFVEVTDVRMSEELSAHDNAVATPYFDETQGIVNVAYSSAANISDVELFCIDFIVVDYTEQYSQVEHVKSSFVNADAVSVNSSIDLGYIQIGNANMSKKGDVDGDKQVTLADLLIIQRSLVNPNYSLNDDQFAMADIDNNGNLDMIDCQYIQNYLVGKIDSLENIGGSGDLPSVTTYSLSVAAMDINGNRLFSGVYTVNLGDEYNVVLNQIRTIVSERYAIKNYAGISSEEYGSLDSSDGLIVKGNDNVILYFELAEGSVVDKKVVYTFSVAIPNEDGSKTALNYTFYSDYTVNGVMELIVDGEVVKKIDQTSKWKQVDRYIDVEMEDGSMERMFVVGADGTLSMYEDNGSGDGDDTEDYIRSISGIPAVGVAVGSDAKTLIEKMTQKTLTLNLASGKELEVAITESMIDYTEVNFNELGEYEAVIHISYNNQTYDIHATVYVIEDMSKVEVVGRYDVVAEGEEDMGGISYITLYADGRVMVEDYSIVPYETITDGVIAFDMDGSDIVLVLGEKTATFYTPAADTPVIGTYVYTRVYAEGMVYQVTFTVYGTYTTPGKYIAVIMMEMMGEQHTLCTRVYLDQENSKLDHAIGCNMTFDEKGNLQENHEYVMNGSREPSCTQDGYISQTCTICGQPDYVTLPMTGHSYGEDGACTVCGVNENELANMRESATMYMQEQWSELLEQYGDEVVSAYGKSYDKYYSGVKNAADTNTIAVVMNEFENLLNEIRNKFGGSGSEEETVCPNSWWLESEIPYSAKQGDDIDAYIENFIIGNRLVVEMSDGQTLYFTVESYMVSGYSADFSNVGQVYIYIHCAQGDFSLEHHVCVSVEPSDDTEYTDYTFEDTGNMGWSSLRIYEGNTVMVQGAYYSFEWYNDNVIVFDAGGMTVVITLDNESGTASFYTPSEADKAIGTYVLVRGDNQWTFVVYGEYTGAGNYIAVMTAIYGDGAGGIKQELTGTTRVFLDLEASVFSFTAFGDMSFDENGNLTMGGSGDIVEPDVPSEEEAFEQYRDEIKDRIKELWSEIEQGGYAVSEEQYAQYNAIMESIYQVGEYWELEDLYSEAEKLCNAIKGIVELEWTSNRGVPHSVVVGTTMEEFLEMLGGAKLILCYTDGTEVEVAFTAEMFDLGKLDLSKEGEYEISWSYQPENLDYALEGTIHVTVITNMAAGANPIGQYTYLPYTEGAQNAMEWNTIKLYDNGWALIRDDYGMSFVEYEMEGDILSYNYYDIVCVMEIVRDDDGNAMGIAFYRPATEEIYVYDDGEDMFFTVEVFKLGDGYFAFFDLREYNYDGTQDCYEMTGELFFNEGKTKLFAMMLEGWFEITENGVLVYTECEHSFDEEGYCQYCGENQNGDEGTPDVGVEDEVVNNENKTESDSGSDGTVSDKVIVESGSINYN